MTRYGMVIDATACTGCDGCFIACKDEFVGNDFPPYTAAQPDTQYGYYPGATPLNGVESASVWVVHGQNWMKNTEVVRGTFPKVKVTTYPQPCMQCADAPCMNVATDGAVYRRPDGVVVFDPVRSVGQEQIVAACPYGAAYWNPVTKIPQKCTFCVHLVDAGQNPKCVDICHMSAIHFGNLDDPTSNVSKFLASSSAAPLHPEYGTKPQVFYVGLPKTFITGALIDHTTGGCLQGATVTVRDLTGGAAYAATSDNYGDFWLDGLDSGKIYMVTISATGKLQKMLEAYTDTNVDLGGIEVF